MPIYFVIPYDLVPGKEAKYVNWLKSDKAKKLVAEFEKETGFKYLNTYMPILGFGDYNCEDWFVAPDFSAFDKMRASKAMDKLFLETWDFIDQTKFFMSRVMRTVQEVRIIAPVKKK